MLNYVLIVLIFFLLYVYILYTHLQVPEDEPSSGERSFFCCAFIRQAQLFLYSLKAKKNPLLLSFRMEIPRCFEPSSPSSWGRVLILNYVALALGFLLPFLTIIVSYSRIVLRLATRFGGGASGGVRRRTAQRSLRLVAAVTATFLLCFLPYHVIRTLHLHAVCGGWDCAATVTLQRAVVVTLCLAASNSVVNPLLYYYSTRTFRNHMRNAHSSLQRRGSTRPPPGPGHQEELHLTTFLQRDRLSSGNQSVMSHQKATC